MYVLLRFVDHGVSVIAWIEFHVREIGDNFDMNLRRTLAIYRICEKNSIVAINHYDITYYVQFIGERGTT